MYSLKTPTLQVIKKMPKRARQLEEPKALEKASATGKVSNEGNDLWLDSPYASRFNVESAPKNRFVAATNQCGVISNAPRCAACGQSTCLLSSSGQRA